MIFNNTWYPGETIKDEICGIPYPKEDIKKIIITFSQYNKSIVKEITEFEDDVDNQHTKFSFKLEQCQTLCFEKGKIDIQVNILTNGGERFTSNITTVDIGGQTYKKVMN